MKAASKAAAGLEEHHRQVIVANGMENTPTLRTIASETKKSLLHRVDVSLISLRVVGSVVVVVLERVWYLASATTLHPFVQKALPFLRREVRVLLF